MESTIKDFCQYLKSESDSEVSAVEETIDNMLMRVEEYKGTLEMIKTQRVDIESTFRNIIALRSKIQDLAFRIDAMEVFISKVHQDMNTLETQLVEAEQDIPNKLGKSFKNLLKPIFSKISSEHSTDSGSNVGMSNATLASYEKIEVFSTDELFKQDVVRMLWKGHTLLVSRKYTCSAPKSPYPSKTSSLRGWLRVDNN